MADGRVSFGLRWFFLLLFAEVVLFGLIFFLRQGEAQRRSEEPPASFSRVQALNLQSLINAKGYACPALPALRYAQRQSGMVIVATCTLPTGERQSYEINFKGRVRPL